MASSGTSKPSYYHSVGDEPLTCLTIGQLLEIAAKKWDDREFLVSVYQGHRYTFKQALDKADRLAAGLHQLGVKLGDRLGIWGPNSSHWCLTRLAAARGGFIAVQIDPAYQAPELSRSLKKVGVKALVFSEFYKDNSCYDIIRNIVPELNDCPDSGAQLNSAQVPSLKSIISMTGKQYKGAYQFDDVIDCALPETLKKIQDLQTMIQPDDGATIQFTSGTTGHPKASLATHHILVNNAIIAGKAMGLNTKVVRHAIGPQFCHVTGSLGGIICGIYYGSTVILPAPTFDAKKTITAIQQERCTNIILTPSLYIDLIANTKQLGASFTTLEVGSIGGAMCSKELAQDMLDVLGIKRVCPVYGMTEIGFAILGQHGDDMDKMTKTVGKIGDHMEAKIVNTEGQMVPMGTRGELWIRGYSITRGYWNDEEKMRDLITSEGWLKTGDQFVLRENGYAEIVGRVKEMIIRIADNIFPVEIEEFFLKHPDVLEAQAFGVPDPKVGEEICVFLRLKEGASLTEQDIVNYCKDKIAEYRIPRYIRFIKEFKRSAMGKILKSELKEMFLQEL